MGLFFGQVVAKDERPVINSNTNEKETTFGKLFQSCWQPKPELRPTMSEIVNILKDLSEWMMYCLES